MLILKTGSSIHTKIVAFLLFFPIFVNKYYNKSINFIKRILSEVVGQLDVHVYMTRRCICKFRMIFIYLFSTVCFFFPSRERVSRESSLFVCLFVCLEDNEKTEHESDEENGKAMALR